MSWLRLIDTTTIKPDKVSKKNIIQPPKATTNFLIPKNKRLLKELDLKEFKIEAQKSNHCKKIWSQGLSKSSPKKHKKFPKFKLIL